MASKYWIKLYHEVLDDPKMGRLPDRLWRRVIELFLIAGDCDEDGVLPSVEDMAWRLRADPAELQQELDAIEKIGIIVRMDEDLVVARFADRQSPVSSSERMRRYRERQHSDEYAGNEGCDESSNGDVTEDVTIRNTDTDTDTDKEIDTEKNHHDVFPEMLSRWAELFPGRPHPTERNKALRGKANTRLKDPDFRERWEEALVRMTRASDFVRDRSWFTLNWFLANDENWRKCADGNYDGKASANGGAIKVRV